MTVNERPGSLLMAFPIGEVSQLHSRNLTAWGVVPSLGSETTRVAFFSSLTPSSRLASMGDTLLSTIAVTSSSADAALSNLAKFLSFNLCKGAVSNSEFSIVDGQVRPQLGQRGGSGQA